MAELTLQLSRGVRLMVDPLHGWILKTLPEDGGALMHYYNQADDQRLKAMDITEGGWCLGVSTQWIRFKATGRTDFWTWMLTPEGAGVIRFVMEGQGGADKGKSQPFRPRLVCAEAVRYHSGPSAHLRFGAIGNARGNGEEHHQQRPALLPDRAGLRHGGRSRDGRRQRQCGLFHGSERGRNDVHQRPGIVVMAAEVRAADGVPLQPALRGALQLPAEQGASGHAEAGDARRHDAGRNGEAPQGDGLLTQRIAAEPQPNLFCGSEVRALRAGEAGVGVRAQRPEIITACPVFPTTRSLGHAAVRFHLQLLTVLPLRGTGQRSNLFESHRSNQWLTFLTDIDLKVASPAGFEPALPP
jgi:hypothetical protein